MLRMKLKVSIRLHDWIDESRRAFCEHCKEIATETAETAVRTVGLIATNVGWWWIIEWLAGRRYTGESSECSSLVGTPTDTGRSFTFGGAAQRVMKERQASHFYWSANFHIFSYLGVRWYGSFRIVQINHIFKCIVLMLVPANLFSSLLISCREFIKMPKFISLYVYLSELISCWHLWKSSFVSCLSGTWFAYFLAVFSSPSSSFCNPLSHPNIQI